MSNQLIISVLSDDRPGIVEQIASLVTQHHGNWLESALSRLGGKFAGIVLVDIPQEYQAELESALGTLSGSGIRVVIDQAGQQSAAGDEVCFDVIGNDRKGIVGEISRLLASHQISVDELYTRTENAPMSGERLFIASASVILPTNMNRDDLQLLLEKLSDDLMVEFEPA
jgi:glycine cleavage system regulatory protein